MEFVDLFDLIQSAKKQVEHQNPGINIILDAKAIPVIEANSEQMQFLLKELLLNAVKFRKPGNVVKVKIYASSLLLNKFRQLSGKYKYAEFLKLQIQDDGIGFDNQYQEQAFELFRVLHQKGGLRIGLSLCKKIVVLDLNMPYLNGRQTFERIKDDTELRSIPVVILTSGESPADKSFLVNKAFRILLNPLSFQIWKTLPAS